MAGSSISSQYCAESVVKSGNDKGLAIRTKGYAGGSIGKTKNRFFVPGFCPNGVLFVGQSLKNLHEELTVLFGNKLLWTPVLWFLGPANRQAVSFQQVNPKRITSTVDAINSLRLLAGFQGVFTCNNRRPCSRVVQY